MNQKAKADLGGKRSHRRWGMVQKPGPAGCGANEEAARGLVSSSPVTKNREEGERLGLWVSNMEGFWGALSLNSLNKIPPRLEAVVIRMIKVRRRSLRGGEAGTQSLSSEKELS